ncbi:LuxR C-terminal-related transcriptional regulator [Actinomadura sp. 9N407]|uniref:helix-turn-helix transcriptional regulator n=1 Tax=Actinomadura sp. 9N407 TaxID=3375154 RepID=UPI003789ADDE
MAASRPTPAPPGPSPEEPGSWPFVGRTTELAAVRSALLDAKAAGVIVVGDAGVGKSWLAAKVAADLDPGRNLVVRAKATRAAARIPYGALAHLLPAERAPGAGPPALAGPVAGDARRRLVLALDDAHDLDPASAALVGDLLARGGARLLATARTGTEVPEPLAALHRDGALHRLELGPLGHAQTVRLLETVVGGQVEDAGARRLWRVAGGNPLFLRELLLAGMLTEDGGVWRCAGGPPLTPRLRELIEARIGAVDEEERLVLEYLALGEPLCEAMLHELAGADAVGRVRRRQLVTVAPDARGARRQLRLAHPLYGEVVRAGTGPLPARARLRRMAEAVEGTGGRRREDVLRVATWRLDSGGETDPGLLLRAAWLAWSALDLELAARLGSAALHAYLARPARRPGSAGQAAALLATVLHFADRDEEAEAALREVAGRLQDDRERGLHAGARGLVLAWGLARDREAGDLLAEAAATITDPAWRRHVLSLAGWVALFAGRVADGLDAVERARAEGAAPRGITAETDSAEALLHAYGGLPGRAVAEAEACMRDADAWRDEVPVVMTTLAHARTVAHLFAGELDEGLAATGRGLELVRGLEPGKETGGWGRVAASFSGWRAQLHRLRGDLHEAVRWSRDGTAKLAGRPAMFAGLCLGELACAAAQLGRAAEAEEALERAAALARPAWHGVDFSLVLARPWVLAARGDDAGAVAAALEAAEDAGRHGLRGYAMFALHDAVRLGAAGRVLVRLRVLAGEVEGPLAPVCARHAAAAAAPDGDALLAVSEEFEGLGMLLYAAEAAAQAAETYENAGRDRTAAAALDRARKLADQCPGARTPALAPLSAPLLTPRQRQIARLAAQGLSNREIAVRLDISMRTVGNHLVTIYERLGVTGRSGLAEFYEAD